jgi:hypothetical protein
MNRLLGAVLATARVLAATVALFYIAGGGPVAKAQNNRLTWHQVEPLVIAARRCIAEHPNSPSACKEEAQRAWDALGRLMPGEGPVLTLPTLPRETACDPTYWAQKLGPNNASSQQAATLAVQTMLDLYHCPTPRAPQPRPVQAPSQNRTCDPRFWAQQIERTAPAGTSDAAKYLAVRKVLELYGCIASTARPPVSPTGACESGHWVSEVTGDGSIVILEDGSRWLVDAVDRVDSALWLPTDSVVACNGMLIDPDDGSKVAARLIQ